MSETPVSAKRRPGYPLVVAGAVILLLTMLFLAAGCSSRQRPVPTPTPTATPAPPAALPAPGAAKVSETPSPLPEPTSVPTPTAVAEAATPEATAVVPPEQAAPDRIVIPKIELDAPIVDVGWQVVDRGQQRFTEWETAESAAGRHMNSARPGEMGNVVLSGHHNTKGEVFRRVSDLELQPGDPIYLYDHQGRRYTYVVDEVTDPPLLEVGASLDERLTNARYIQPSEDARVTLVTCWPYWTNTHRVVVVGKLVTDE